MRAILQRVEQAFVEAGGETVGAIGRGVLVLLGVERGDGRADAAALAAKLGGLRAFRGRRGQNQPRGRRGRRQLPGGFPVHPGGQPAQRAASIVRQRGAAGRRRAAGRGGDGGAAPAGFRGRRRPFPRDDEGAPHQRRPAHLCARGSAREGALAALRGDGTLNLAEVFAGLETHGFAGGDRHLDPGLGIAADAFLAVAHLEDPEAAQLDAFAFLERVFHAFEDGVYRQRGLDPGHVRDFGDAIDEIGFDHLTFPQ